MPLLGMFLSGEEPAALDGDLDEFPAELEDEDVDEDESTADDPAPRRRGDRC